MSRSNGRRGVILLGVAAAAVVLGLPAALTGLYVVPRYELATSCDACSVEREVVEPHTLLYLRPGLGLPFVASDGGLLIRFKREGLSLPDRLDRMLALRGRVLGRTFLRLPYLPFLYGVSAGGRAPVKYDEAF